MAQEEKSVLKEAIKAVKERKNELKLQQKTIANLKAEITKVEQQKAKDAKRKAELKLQIDTMLHTIEERRALRNVIEQHNTDAEAVQQETWTDLVEVEEQLQTVRDGVELADKTNEYHKDCMKKMIGEFNNMKLQLTNAVVKLDSNKQQKHQKKETELTAFREGEAQWLATIQKEIDETKIRIAARDELNRQKEDYITRRKEKLAQLRAHREERQILLAGKKKQTRKAQEELDVVTLQLIKAKERERVETERREAVKKRLEASQAKRVELLAESLDKSQLRQEGRVHHEAKIREFADKVEAERKAIKVLTLEQSEAHTEFNALYRCEKTEFEAIRRRMADEAVKLKSELDEETKAVQEMRAELVDRPTADELRALVEQLRAEIREMIELNVKLAQEERALEEKENADGSPMQGDGSSQETASVSCSRRLPMSVAPQSQSQQLLSPMLQPLPQPTPPKRVGRVSGPAVDHPTIVNVAKASKRATTTNNRKNDRLATPKQTDSNGENIVDSMLLKKITNNPQMSTPTSPLLENDDSSQTSDASMWSPLDMQ